MTQKTSVAVGVVAPGAGRVLHAFGEEVHLHLTGELTGGRSALWTEITPPGGGPPPHYHLNEDEQFFVVEGRVAFLKDGRWTEVGPGASAFMPRGVPHTFRNVGDQPLRMLISSSPAGFEVFFARCADEFARPEGPDMGRVVGIAAEHGIHFLPPGSDASA